MKRTTFIVLLFMVLYSFRVQAEESLWICGTAVKTGMNKSEVFSKMKACSILATKEDNKPTNNFLIQNRITSEDVGFIQFDDNDTVFRVSRDWTETTDLRAIRFAETLFNALHDLIGEDGRDVTIQTTRSVGPNMTVENISIAYGYKPVRTISITIVQAPDITKTAKITEAIRRPISGRPR